jgi:hypothetical protein
VLLDKGSFREYDMFVEHACTDFGMGREENKVCFTCHRRERGREGGNVEGGREEGGRKCRRREGGNVEGGRGPFQRQKWTDVVAIVVLWGATSDLPCTLLCLYCSFQVTVW